MLSTGVFNYKNSTTISVLVVLELCSKGQKNNIEYKIVLTKVHALCVCVNVNRNELNKII